MKTSVKQYAQILLSKTTRAKSADEIKKIIEAFASILVEDGMISKFPDIMKIFSKIWDQKHGTVDAFIAINSTENFDIESLHLPKHINTIIKEDNSLIGGVSIIMGDYLIENSIRNNLRELKESISLK